MQQIVGVTELQRKFRSFFDTGRQQADAHCPNARFSTGSGADPL